MKQTKPLLLATAIALSSLFSGAVLAQTSPDQDAMAMSAKPGLTDGEVRKIDKEAGKLTIRHGEIKHLEMPPMTMVFVAKDKSMLDKVKAGDKVRFMVIHENGQMIVTDLQPSK
ncbi:MAG: copper-binding protein [Gammaproteobacteria bacterium]|uniref:copper-binding protein n=1 Tax=Rhodoferax sp. TaxID=50421 RepID=UPI0017B713CE|nr:copper-binding protein [Rhodoferax sp.]MBU3898537.1 copper-binding protein [Gammaproteobacteria bacterium]MBA3056838.1 copper-binding protein [Rhodoferax sp.]MBU3997864.1 copper-binding protein [Gammaproteobacteria bacterium]MBU4079312.1 copper-binding protein [Gammaproteobacteria bacterium]MBU4113226.1 copper-binding protein [Gammaproteobacteria bacterium]